MGGGICPLTNKYSTPPPPLPSAYVHLLTGSINSHILKPTDSQNASDAILKALKYVARALPPLHFVDSCLALASSISKYSPIAGLCIFGSAIYVPLSTDPEILNPEGLRGVPSRSYFGLEIFGSCPLLHSHAHFLCKESNAQALRCNLNCSKI